MKNLIYRVRAIDCILVLIFSFAFYLYYQRVHPLFGDEFNILVQAQRVIDGQVPYRDFFQFITPGSIYLSALWLKLFGKSIWSIRALSALEGALIALFVYLLVKKITNSKIIIAIVLLSTLCFCTTFWPFVSHHWLSTIFSIISVYFMSEYIERKRRILLLCSALFAGFTFLVLQNKGALLFIALELFIIIDYSLFSSNNRSGEKLKKILKDSISLSAMFFLPFLILFIYLVRENALNDFIYDSFVWVLGPYRKFNVYPSYFFIGNYAIYKIFTENPFPLNLLRIRDLIVIGYLPPLLTGLSIFYSIGILNRDRAKFTNAKRNMILFTITGGFMFVSILYRADQVHITFIFPFMLLLLGIVFDKWLRMWEELRRIRKVILAGLIFFFLFYSAYGAVSRLRFAGNFRFPIETKIGKIYTYEKKLQNYYQELFKALEEKMEEKKAFVYLWSSFVYYIFDKENPAKYDSVIPGYNTDEQLREIVVELERAKVNYIFYDGIDTGLARDPFAYSYPMANLNLNNPLSKYISENFIEIYKIQYDENAQFCKILKRKGK